jgi:hypothetical protein
MRPNRGEECTALSLKQLFGFSGYIVGYGVEQHQWSALFNIADKGDAEIIKEDDTIGRENSMEPAATLVSYHEFDLSFAWWEVLRFYSCLANDNFQLHVSYSIEL